MCFRSSVEGNPRAFFAIASCKDAIRLGAGGRVGKHSRTFGGPPCLVPRSWADFAARSPSFASYYYQSECWNIF